MLSHTKKVVKTLRLAKTMESRIFKAIISTWARHVTLPFDFTLNRFETLEIAYYLCLGKNTIVLSWLKILYPI